MNKIAQEIVKEVTDEQEARLARVEHLMDLKKDLQQGAESSAEILREIIDSRRETCHTLGVDIAPLDAILADVQNAFETVISTAQAAQFQAMKSG